MKWLRVIPIATFLFAYSVMAQDDLTPTLSAPTATAPPGLIAVGAVAPFFAIPPQGWLPCDGSNVAAADYPHLQSALNATIDSEGLFDLPDCSGRALVASGFGENLLPVNPGDLLTWELEAGTNEVIAGLGISYFIWSGYTEEEVMPTSTPLPEVVYYATLAIQDGEIVETYNTAVDLTITAGDFAIALMLLGVIGLLAVQIVQNRRK